jgi:uncharacterized pyridoxal phosphate-containing UPF0001 family protein
VPRWRTSLTWVAPGRAAADNKTAQAAAFDWVETVDRMKIAQRHCPRSAAGAAPLGLHRGQRERRSIESGVAPHGGCAGEGRGRAAESARARHHGRPAPTADAAVARAQFRALRGASRIADAGLAVDTLSMGMSADLELAVAEGAAEVRVGTAIFGAIMTP